jgi:predicted CopG family antitoxin
VDLNRAATPSEAAVVDRLTAMRGTGESHSDVILRLIEPEAQSTA